MAMLLIGSGPPPPPPGPAALLLLRLLLQPCSRDAPTNAEKPRKPATRNRRRFPSDFAFRLTTDEHAALLSQNVISKNGGRGGRKTPPTAFTEQGLAMLSSVLRSDRAIDVNVAIMRVFVRIREVLATHKDLARRMADLERQQKEQGSKITDVFNAIQKLLERPPEKTKRTIGFQPPKR